MARFFKYRGYDVTFVKNFTRRGRQDHQQGQNTLGRTIGDIADQYIREHDEDMDAIGVQRRPSPPVRRIISTA